METQTGLQESVRDAEKAALGSMMLSPVAAAAVTERLTGPMFYSPAHETIYQALTHLYIKTGKVDAITATDYLTHTGELSKVGGAAYLHTITSFPSTAALAEQYAEAVRTDYIRRTAKTAITTADEALSRGGDVHEIIGKTTHEFDALTRNSTAAKPTQMGGYFEETLRLLDEGASGYPTGLSDLDDSTGGTSDDNLAAMHGRNIGDLLNAKDVSWGWFEGGFRPTGRADDHVVCGAKHNNIGGQAQRDYSPHHEPFQYYESTANPKHLPPSSVGMVGRSDQANHQYDVSDFNDALAAGNLPEVSYLKPPKSQDGHAGNSDPLDEQRFVVDETNRIQQSKDWASTMVVVAYDDSDGWYDHVVPPKINGSHDPAQDSADACGDK